MIGKTRFAHGYFDVELLPPETMLTLHELPLATSIKDDAVHRMQQSARLIEIIDDLADSIAMLVRSAHILVADRGYDISHSTPDLPLSIFVSVPSANEKDAVPRLAESIIHEAMHLQLTLMESLVPLVRTTAATAFSPWKQSERPVRGVLHGLYVFAVVHEALGVMAERDSDVVPYAALRQSEIAAEALLMGDGRAALTDAGVQLWERLMRRILEGAPD